VRLTALLIIIVFLFTALYLVLEVFSDFNSAVVTVTFWVIFGVVLSGLIALHLQQRLKRKRHEQAVFAHQEDLRRQIDERAASLGRLIQISFLVRPCSSCAEFRMVLLELSPNARSVRYECLHCGKKMRAMAGSASASEATAEWSRLESLVGELKRVSSSGVWFNLQFETAPGPLPYEQTTREAIPSHVRSEVWRRDRGSCAACGSKSNLQFDHIIPVSRGGATTVQNLQLLCTQCNLSKSARV
jgi:hypothetical protein